MTYEDAVKEINSRLRFGIKPGLERMTSLMNMLGNPQDRLRYIHVAGTNGKGSASTLLASVLSESGIRTGLYTSPYIAEFRERFMIDGKMIPKESLARLVEELLPHVKKLEESGETVTEFEFITALAFCWFAKENCGAVVLEVGLGGRFDATNIIRVPEAAVIMSISLDHTGILGDTLEKIAFEKAGVIKSAGKVILYPLQAPQTFRVIENACAERGAELIIPDMSEIEIVYYGIDGSEIVYKGTRAFTPFAGKHQILNAATVIETLCTLKRLFPVTDASIENGFRKSFAPARMEIVSKEPLILLDGGHNPGCAQALRDILSTFASDRELTAVIGMMADKDVNASLKILSGVFARIITVTPANPRAMPAKELADIAAEFCLDVSAADSCAEAADRALAFQKPGSGLVVCGSFYLAGEIRAQLKEKAEKMGFT